MTALTLDTARTILDATLAAARHAGLKPVAVIVIDARGAQKAFAAEDGTSLKRGEIAIGKAHGAVALGVGSRAIAKMAADRAPFVAAATHATGGALVPAAGGVLIKDGSAILGAVGVSGDTSDNDEKVALAGIAAAGLTGDGGEG